MVKQKSDAVTESNLFLMELGNSQSETAIKMNVHSYNDNYAQGKTGFEIKDGGESHKTVPSGELLHYVWWRSAPIKHTVCSPKHKSAITSLKRTIKQTSAVCVSE